MPLAAQVGRFARFASYSFDPNTGDLTRNGIRLRLETQPAKILELLIAADGDLVPRSELIATLWPGEIEGNFARRLDKAVAKLRASLNDNPVSPRYIETLKGKGYRFIADVALEPAAPSQSDVPPQGDVLPGNTGSSLEESMEKHPDSQSPTPFLDEHSFGRLWVSAIALFTLVVAISVSWFESRPAPPHHHRPVILIAGFSSPQSSGDEWISQSVSHWLTTALETGGDLQVVHGEDNGPLRAEITDTECGRLPKDALRTVDGESDADMVVYGSSTVSDDAASGSRWGLNVCLENTRDNRPPQSITLVGTEGDIAQLALKAGELLRSRLGLKQLSGESLGFLRATLPSNRAAARLYAEGSLALQRFQPEEASALLTQAAQLDPQHAATHAALSTAWAALGYQQKSQQEALLAKTLSSRLSRTQQLEYEGLADEASNDWGSATSVYRSLLQRYPDSIDYALKLANAQTNSAKSTSALETLHALRNRNPAALKDPRVNLAEATADSALSDFKGQLAASTKAESLARLRGAGAMIADAQMSQGNADDALGNWSEASRLWRMSGQSYESIGDRDGMADVLNREADLFWKKGDSEKAINLFKQSIALSKTTGDDARLAYSLSHLGIVRMAVDRAPGGEMPKAVQMYRQSATLYQKLGNIAEEGYVFSLLGDEAMQRTQFEPARSFYVKAMSLSEEAHDNSRIAGRLLDLGIVELVEGHNLQAMKLFSESAEEFDKLGEKDRAAISRIRLGVSLYRAGKIDDAERTLQNSLEVMRSFGRLNQVREVLGDLAKVELWKDPQQAERVARENLSLNQQILVKRGCCSPSVALLAETLLSEGELPEAQDAIHEAFSSENEIPREWLPEMLLTRGNIRMAKNDLGGADADFKRALEMGNSRGDRYFELQARLGLAEVDILRKARSSKIELERLKDDADNSGMAVFDIKIAFFLRTLHPAP